MSSCNRDRLDALIQRYAPAWPVAQIAVIDRNVLRIALLELSSLRDTPPKVAINEAVDLAKLFGSDSSSRFVNGVLGAAMSAGGSIELPPTRCGCRPRKGLNVDILGIGPLELVLILVIALMVFGPDKLPEIGAKMGKGVRELRQLSREISQGVNTITEPMEELRKPFDEAGQIAGQISAGAAALSNPAQALQNSLEKQLTAPSAEPAAAVSTAEDNTIAPPRAAESAAPVAALAATDSVAADPVETAAPAAQLAERSCCPPRWRLKRLCLLCHSSVAPAPAAAPDTLDEAAADTAADPPATESPSPATER